LIGGADAPGNLEFINLVRYWGGNPEATILIHGGKVPVQSAAMLNSVMARSFDFEPVSPEIDGRLAPGHVSGTTVMTAITMGEAGGISGRELLCALLVGDDVTTRVLLAGAGFGLKWGWCRIGPINPFGATAIAGRILGLNKKQMINAFGIVLNQLSGSFDTIQNTTTAFKLTQGTAARDGVFSAQLARIGWTGPVAIYSEDKSFSVFSNRTTKLDVFFEQLQGFDIDRQHPLAAVLFDRPDDFAYLFTAFRTEGMITAKSPYAVRTIRE
jgi:2-methylcitrate dehydratase PrpD